MYFYNITEKNQGKWKKYLKKIEKAVKEYKDCTQDECSCHRRYDISINLLTVTQKPSKC